MNIEQYNTLQQNADTSHEDAVDWYADYGWHLETEREGCIELQAVLYPDLDGDDDALITMLRADYSSLSRGEAQRIVTRAREVRDAADEIESLLDQAVHAYERGDYAATVAALESASRAESEHGDDPATSDLAARLLRVADYTCPRCGGSFDDEDGYCEGPRNYHATCWHQMTSREQQAAWDDAESGS